MRTQVHKDKEINRKHERKLLLDAGHFLECLERLQLEQESAGEKEHVYMYGVGFYLVVKWRNK